MSCWHSLANSVGSYGSVPALTLGESGMRPSAQGNALRHVPIINTFYQVKSVGRTDRMASMRQPFDSDADCPEHLKVSMLQARALNPDYYLAEDGHRCLAFCQEQ